ncbi:hypothetical protein PFICI_11258 [Pestalotiopsis fici W106-1]|uniref:DUF7514 domain-containing protein n=1 Tax=Pestalotiopsis fici (strain W106-1 / CGMCC3.15140) TaxID=1229662 RepID=W3WUB1_PESFW|nr:uncharacterized protein PFICI_11258 [Pestalotiopsis fici W106-1]ETS77384.1 hypothetical protein PFICI_11258 [Pestalotiopsis fici W106-1]
MTKSHELNPADNVQPKTKAHPQNQEQQLEASGLSVIGEQANPDELYGRLDLVLGLHNLSPPWTPVGSSVSSHQDSLPMTQQAPIMFEKTPRSNTAIEVFDTSLHNPFSSRDRSEKETVSQEVDWLDGCRQLFDEHGVATQSLGKALQRLAKYIIDEYAPKKSLVITPDKIAAFYTAYRQDSDVVPFVVDVNDCLEDFYDRLRIEHLLIQKNICSRPRIPALSVDGFARYLAICVLAYPNEEIRRLDRAFVDLPLALDAVELNERARGMLKTIPEAYLPIKHDRVLRRRLDDAFLMLMTDLKMTKSICRDRQYMSPNVSHRGREAGDYFSIPKSNPLSPKSYWATRDDRVRLYSPRESQAKYIPGTLQTIDDDVGQDRGFTRWNRPQFRWESSSSSRSGASDTSMGGRLNVTSPAARDPPLSPRNARSLDQYGTAVEKVAFGRNESPQLRLDTASVLNIYRRGPPSSAPSSYVCTPSGYSSKPPIDGRRVSTDSLNHKVQERRHDELAINGPLSPLTGVSPRQTSARPYHERQRSSEIKRDSARGYLGDKHESYIERSSSGRGFGGKHNDSQWAERERKRDTEPERQSSHRRSQPLQRPNVVRTESNRDDRGRSSRDEDAHKRDHKKSEKTATARRH